jgi:hypothetical protein
MLEDAAIEGESDGLRGGHRTKLGNRGEKIAKQGCAVLPDVPGPPYPLQCGSDDVRRVEFDDFREVGPVRLAQHVEDFGQKWI